ncbi:metalloprotease [Mycena rebaudengoi]|nr:metalloprotease [Mycena rebaudengoi]
MLACLSFLLLVVPSLASGDAYVNSVGSCGSHVSSDVQRATRAQFAGRATTDLTRRAPDCGTAGPATANLNVHWHVVYANETYDGGFLSDAEIAAQIAFLNSEYAKFVPLAFTLVNTTRTLDEDKFTLVREKQSDMRTELVTKLHAGAELDINVYSLSFTFVPDLRGFSSFPWDYKTNPVADGIMIKWNSLPGGKLKSNGGSLVHEVGHWLGLYHTWQEGCTSPNDEVDDTPAEDPQNAGRGLQTCPATFDSCPDLPGADPVHNYMTYANDDCRNEFTKGQVARLLEQSGTHRALTLACPKAAGETDPNVKGNNKPTSDSNSSGNPTGSASKTDSGAPPAGTGGARGVARPWMGVVLGVVAGVSWGRWM